MIPLVDAPTSATPALRGSPLWSAWFRIVTASEFLGFAVPAVVGALTAGSAPAMAVPALLAAGAVEGTMLGWGQATVLRRALPDLKRARWIVATAAAAVLAYGIGVIPSSFGEALASWPTGLLVPVVGVLGTVLLLSIGTAQWLVLRHHIPSAGRWIAVTAVAWLVGLAVFMGFTMPLWQPGQPIAYTVLIGVAGGLLMAATTSAITGAGLRRLLGPPVR
jgi:hypothetical protein